MKTKILIAGIVLIAGTLARSATNDLVSALQRGLFEEEANHNLDAAAQAYQAVSTQFDKDRKLAATAIFRLGEVYRKQGKTNEATAQYERIVREFSDQQTLVTLSRQNLSGLSTKKEPTISSPLTRAARLEQKGLLEEEIKLVELDLADLRKQLANGVVPQSEVRAKEREVLKLRQQVAALIVDDTEVAAGASSTPVTDDEEKEIRRIQEMIKNSPDLINAKDQARGATPLHNAAGLGQLTVASFLLANGGDIEAKDRTWSGATPLHYAADAGHKGIVELLLSKGADGKAATSNGDTSLHFASRRGFKSIVEVLLAAGADANARGTGGATPLVVAAVNGFKNVAETLLKAKADPNVVTRNSIKPTTGGGSYFGAPIHIAISRGDGAMWELLLANGADVNLKDSSGRTPLREAVENEQMAAVEMLLGKNADVNIGDANGTTPLLVGVDRQKPELVKSLLEDQADPEAAGTVYQRQGGGITSGGAYPLQLAIEKGNLEILKLLLDRGVDVNSERKCSGTTFAPPIWSALGLEKTNVLKLLLQFKADPNVVDANGKTPLIQALNYPVRKETVEMLVTAGADVKPADKNGWTALHFAVGYGLQDLAALILNKGANPNALNNDRQTPLDVAKIHRAQRSPVPSAPGSAASVQWEEIIALLRQHGALDDLPDFTSIRVTRVGIAQPIVVFVKDTNSLNRFTLLEVVRNFYPEVRGIPPSLPFPDFSKIVIHRPEAGSPGAKKEIVVNLLTVTNSFDCAKDTWLEFGDLVEIPEREHTLAEQAIGLTSQQNLELGRCLEGKVTFVVRGQKAEFKLTGLSNTGWLQSALDGVRNLLRSSSDLSHIKIARTDPTTGKASEFITDSKSPGPNNVWLRDGDVIEVPDKP